MNDPAASTQPCTTWSRANKIRLASRRSSSSARSPPASCSRRSISATKSAVSRGEPALKQIWLTPNTPMLRTVRRCLRAPTELVGGRSSPKIGSDAMLGPKNPLLATMVVGLTNGTVSAMKCAAVIAPYSRWANTATVRTEISRWTIPPGRSRSAIPTPVARRPRTVTEADDGENGPGSASDKLVARKVGNRGSIGVSNSPLSPSGPANLGTTPSSAAASTAGTSVTLGTRQGSDITRLPRATRPRAARAKSSRHSSALHAGENPHVSLSREVFRIGAISRPAKDAQRRASPAGQGTIGRPSALAIRRRVSSPGAARSTGPLSISVSRIARTSSRSVSSRCTTCTGRSTDEPAKAGCASSWRTRSSTLRPMTRAQRIATQCAPEFANSSSARVRSVCAEEAKTMRLVPVSAIASRTFRVPARPDTQCATTSAPATACPTETEYRMSPATKSAALGQLSGRCREIPTTSWPWLSNRATRPRPITPPASVTAILMG